MPRCLRLPAIALAAALALLVISPAAVHVLVAAGDSARMGLAQGVAATFSVLALHRRLWLGLSLLVPFALLAPVELWYLLNFQKPSDAHAIGILFDADWAEARAFAGGVTAPLVLAVISAAALAVAAVLLARREGLAWVGRGRLALLSACAVALALPWLLNAVTPDVQAGVAPISRPPAEVGDSLATDPLDLFARELSTSYPAGVPLRIAEFLHHRSALRELSASLQAFRFGAALEQANAPAREIHVLVIGETGRPDRWQVNGYGRPTSPRLAAEPNLTSFTDVVSPWAWTRMSVPVILSRKPGTDTRPFFPERSVVAAFREAGFRTAWFSTQSPLGVHDSSIALHAHEAHEVRFVNPVDYKRQAAHDGDLLPLLRRALARDEPRQFIVLHTLGSHYNYSHRYPPEFDRFRPSLRDVPRPSLHDRGQRGAMANAYDNSVLYTDHVLGEAIAALRATGAVATLFYIADHGENLFDGECALSGHGRHTERDFRVAAFFWHSDAYAVRHPEKLRLAKQRAAARLSTENVFHSLLDMAAIRYPGERLDRSLFHPSWQPRPRIVQTGADFDLAGRDPVCLLLQQAQRSPL